MQVFDRLNDNKLMKAVLEDVPSTEPADDTEINEHQFYVQRVGFYVVHTIAWCQQLHMASEFLSNFDYSKKISASRADHLIYNVENYLIRLNSVYDRVLQLVNAVFHLCIGEENISHGVVVGNYRVQHDSDALKKIKAIRKYLEDYAQDRHTLVHKHSLLDVKLRRIERMYVHDLRGADQNDEHVKLFKIRRAAYLRDYVVEKKDEFVKINLGLVDLIDQLFDVLHGEYGRQRESFRLRGL